MLVNHLCINLVFIDVISGQPRYALGLFNRLRSLNENFNQDTVGLVNIYTHVHASIHYNICIHGVCMYAMYAPTK